MTVSGDLEVGRAQPIPSGAVEARVVMEIARPRRRPPRLELRCSSCGYGAVVRTAPDRCPMCGGTVWEHAERPYPPHEPA